MSSLKQTCQEIWWSWGWKNILKCLICNQTLFMKKRKSMSTFNSVDLWFNCPPLAPCMVSAGLSLLCWSLFGISGPTPDWRALISPTHPLLPLPLNWSALRVCSGWWREGWSLGSSEFQMDFRRQSFHTLSNRPPSAQQATRSWMELLYC